MLTRRFTFLTGTAVGTGILLLSCQSGDAAAPPANTAPTATISTPTPGALFAGGDTIAYSGTGSDPEEGELPPGRFTWWVDLHHSTHTHPFVPKTVGVMSGRFVVPTRGHTEDNIFLRIHLVVTDGQGLADTTFVDVPPRKATISLASTPSALQVTLDGQPQTAPFSVVSVVGMERDLGVSTPQVVGADSLIFDGWSDAGSADHTVVTPATDTTFTATFRQVATVNQHPVVQVTAPSDGAIILQGTATPLTATASDPDGSVATVEFLDNDAPIGVDSAAPYGLTWTPIDLGAHNLTARATDNEGATTTSGVIGVSITSVGIDKTPPTVQITSPTDGTTGITGALNIAATAVDNVGVVGVTFEVDGVRLPEVLTAPYQVSVPSTSGYADGVHVIRARARDARGNRSAWVASRVTFSNGSALPSGFRQTPFATGLSGPLTAMAFSPDGHRLFVTELGGALRVIKDGVLLPTPFVTVPTTADGERGLLGVALHPQFATNGWVYLYYTASADSVHNRIVRYTAGGDEAAGAETVVVDLPPLSSSNIHNGGALQFGPDGKLYVAVGDNATSANAQSLGTPFGKLLRFNDDGSIPPDNPFYGGTTGINQAIWALGLRNPFSFSFQPGTGRMFINDVGQNNYEEINDGLAGANYGWPRYEGPTGVPPYVNPVFAYRHIPNPTLVIGDAIVGSAFYNPPTLLFPTEYRGGYFFADYAGGWVNRMDPVRDYSVYAFWNEGSSITDVQVGPDGALYVLGDINGSAGVTRIGYP